MEPHGDQRPRRTRVARRLDRSGAICSAPFARGRSWIVVPTLAAFVAGLVFVTLVSPRYTAFTKVLLENEENYFTRPDKATLDLAAPYDPEAVQSEAEMIATADLARKAIAKLGLMEKSEFNPAISRNPFSALLSLLTDGPRRANAVEDRVVESFLSRLTVFPIAQIARAADRILERRSRARGSRRQRGRRPVPERKGRGQAGSGQGRRGLAVGQDRRNCAPRSPRRTPRSRRFASNSGLSGGGQRHDGALAATGRNHHPDRFGARRAIGRGGQGAAAARNVARGTARRGPRCSSRTSPCATMPKRA